MALIGFHHVAAEPLAQGNALEHLAEHAAAEGHLVAAVAAFEGLKHPPAIRRELGKIKRKAGVGVFEPPVDKAMGRWSVAKFILVDIGLAEITVGDPVAVGADAGRAIVIPALGESDAVEAGARHGGGDTHALQHRAALGIGGALLIILG